MLMTADKAGKWPRACYAELSSTPGIRAIFSLTGRYLFSAMESTIKEHYVPYTSKDDESIIYIRRSKPSEIQEK